MCSVHKSKKADFSRLEQTQLKHKEVVRYGHEVRSSASVVKGVECPIRGFMQVFITPPFSSLLLIHNGSVDVTVFKEKNTYAYSYVASIHSTYPV